MAHDGRCYLCRSGVCGPGDVCPKCGAAQPPFHFTTKPKDHNTMNLSLSFKVEKETKGAVRYQEVGPDGQPAFAPMIGSLYVRKSAMEGGKIPQTLAVTVTAGA